MASVRKKKRAYKGKFYHEWVIDYNDAAGKRCTETRKTKGAAEARLDEIKREMRDGTHVTHRDGISVKEAGEAWIKACDADGLERSTLDQYRQHLNLHIVPFLGDTRLPNLTIPAVKHFQGKLRQQGRSPDMIKRVTVSLGSILAEAQESGCVGRNVVREMTRRRRKGKDSQSKKRQTAKLRVGFDIPAPAEIRAIIDKLKGRWRPLILTAIFTGLRASELRGLRWADVDLDAAALHVRQRADRYHAIGMPKSGDGQRTVPMPPIVVNTLRAWKLECPRRGRTKDHPGELHYVFPNGKGNIEFHANIAKRGLIPVQIAADVSVPLIGEDGKPVLDAKGNPVLLAKYPGLHALRHFYASWCINRKVDGGLELPPKIVQSYLGHANITLTMDTYGHLFQQTDTSEALAAAERALLLA